MAAKPPGGGGVPPRAPTAPRAPQAPRVAPQPQPVPIAPPTPKVSVEEAAAAAAGIRPRPPSTPDDWESTDVTRPHDMMLSRDDVRTIVQDEMREMRARFAQIHERLQALERAQLTPVAPAVRSPPAPIVAPIAPVIAPVVAPVAPVIAPVAPIAPAPVAPIAVAPSPPPLPVAAKAAPVVVADRTSDPFGAVVAAGPPPTRPAAMDIDLSPDDIPFDGSRRRRRITVAVLLLLLITVGTFVGIAMTSQMRAGH